MPARQKYREESTETYKQLQNEASDGLIIASKQHPLEILLNLTKYVKPSRPFVVFSPYKEPLMEAYMAVKSSGKAVMVTLSETWMRHYQVTLSY